MFIAADRPSLEEGGFGNNREMRMITRVTGLEEGVGVNAGQRTAK